MTQPKPIRKVAIIGGGTAGWMTAAWFGRLLSHLVEEIVLVESDEIGIVGVGEATIPSIRKYNHIVGIDEDEMLRRTQGTFKLGIEFVNWGKIGDRYHHAFGPNGRDLNYLPFHAYWLRQHLSGKSDDLIAFNLQAQAALAGKFMRPTGSNSPLATLVYAFQFDASLYAKYLRELAEAASVTRIEGKIVDVKQRPDDGFIDTVVLENGQSVDADLFIDCTGFHGLLIEQTLKTGFVDWSHWLPCDRAWAVPCERVADPLPFTRATAHGSGWQWRIPLQHRTGNGHVFASAFIDEDTARDVLMNNLDGKPQADPRLLRFKAGRRKQFWVKNVVAIGLAGGFLEPLESTSIFLIQSAISRLHSLFPDSGFDPADIDFFNAESIREYEDVRDFIILHYKQTQRTDSAFWDHCRTMDVPDRLTERMRLFEAHGRIFEDKGEAFGLSSWLQVMAGQNLTPRAFDPLALSLSEAENDKWLADVRDIIAKCRDHMPSHQAFIDAHCKASPLP
jgi:tryptophan halogenase